MAISERVHLIANDFEDIFLIQWNLNKTSYKISFENSVYYPETNQMAVSATLRWQTPVY